MTMMPVLPLAPRRVPPPVLRTRIASSCRCPQRTRRSLLPLLSQAQTAQLTWKRHFFASFCYPIDQAERLRAAKVHVFDDVRDDVDLPPAATSSVGDVNVNVDNPEGEGTTATPTVRLYALLDPETSPDDAERVRHLRLAQLGVVRYRCGDSGDGTTTTSTAFGARVVQNKIGSTSDACSKLLEYAFEHERRSEDGGDRGGGGGGGGIGMAVTTLHGLERYVSERLGKKLEDMTDEEVDAAVRRFVEGGDGDAGGCGGDCEARLYARYGGVVDAVLRGHDNSAFADTSGGFMATMKFSTK